jgi:PilZ domain
MHNARRHPRITDVRDVRARFGSGGGSRGVDRVLNLSEGGMLVADDTLNVGQSTAFELSGPDFHYAGVAEVMHLTNETAGLRFLSWQARDNRPIRSLIEQRSDWHAPANASDQGADRVIRRVAVLTGPTRRSPARTPSPPAESGLSPNR